MPSITKLHSQWDQEKMSQRKISIHGSITRSTMLLTHNHLKDFKDHHPKIHTLHTVMSHTGQTKRLPRRHKRASQLSLLSLKWETTETESLQARNLMSVTRRSTHGFTRKFTTPSTHKHGQEITLRLQPRTLILHMEMLLTGQTRLKFKLQPQLKLLPMSQLSSKEPRPLLLRWETTELQARRLM